MPVPPVVQAPKQQKAALAALAAFAAAVLVNAAPVEAAEVKNVVCASNPTAKLVSAQGQWGRHRSTVLLLSPKLTPAPSAPLASCACSALRTL